MQANAQLEKEESEVEKAISGIIEVQVCHVCVCVYRFVSICLSLCGHVCHLLRLMVFVFRKLKKSMLNYSADEEYPWQASSF